MFFEKKIEAEIENEEIIKITFNNDNNYSVSFYNFGGYIDSIRIPYQNNLSQSEDVLLGYKNFQGYVKDQSYFNCIVGRVCGRTSNAKFNLNDKQYSDCSARDSIIFSYPSPSLYFNNTNEYEQNLYVIQENMDIPTVK